MLPRGKLDDYQRYIYQLNAKYKRNLICALSEGEISKVHAMSSAKEMSDTLALAHEGLKGVKEIN